MDLLTIILWCFVGWCCFSLIIEFVSAVKKDEDTKKKAADRIAWTLIMTVVFVFWSIDRTWFR